MMADGFSQSTFHSMGTLVSCLASGPESEEAVSETKKNILELERNLSRFRPDSEIWAINEAAGKRHVSISTETCGLLEKALDLCRFSEGRFDVTVGPLMDLWGDFASNGVEPEASAIKKALELVDFKDLAIDSDNRTAFLARLGQKIDLGAIGKGYAADHALAKMKLHGIPSAYVNIGGNVATLGKKPDGSPWQIGILHPRRLNVLIGSVAVTDKSVVTSGDYYRGYDAGNGRRVHHILDISTGYPVNTGIISATVVSDSSLMADALSTILFASGIEESFELLRRLKGNEAILVDEHLGVYLSAGIEGAFRAADDIRPLVL